MQIDTPQGTLDCSRAHFLYHVCGPNIGDWKSRVQSTGLNVESWVKILNTKLMAKCEYYKQQVKNHRKKVDNDKSFPEFRPWLKVPQAAISVTPEPTPDQTQATPMRGQAQETVSPTHSEFDPSTLLKSASPVLSDVSGGASALSELPLGVAAALVSEHAHVHTDVQDRDNEIAELKRQLAISEARNRVASSSPDGSPVNGPKRPPSLGTDSSQTNKKKRKGFLASTA